MGNVVVRDYTQYTLKHFSRLIEESRNAFIMTALQQSLCQQTIGVHILREMLQNIAAVTYNLSGSTTLQHIIQIVEVCPKGNCFSHLYTRFQTLASLILIMLCLSQNCKVTEVCIMSSYEFV
jgi:hypothetical protein